MRDKIGNKIQAILDRDYNYGDMDKIYMADWDLKRLSFEGTVLSDMYYTDPDTYQAILDRACKGTGHFIENINSVEVHVCKI